MRSIRLDPTSVSLDKYLANNTTEDNASFIEIIEDAERKREARLAQFFPSRSANGSKLAVSYQLDHSVSCSEIVIVLHFKMLRLQKKASI